MTDTKTVESKGLTRDQKFEALLDLLAANGMTIPDKLRPAKGK